MIKTNQIDFIGIGSAKSGSTWVANVLHQHPDILFSAEKSQKELNFFNSSNGNDFDADNASHYSKGIDWYLDQFPDYKKGKLRGEFSTSYLLDNTAHKRIFEHFPKSKILVILRNPVEMIYSLYWWAKSAVRVTVPTDFDVAVKHKMHKELFLYRGLYYTHLKKYYDLFPSENIYTMILYDVKNKPQKEILKLYKFLNVDHTYTPPNLEQKVNPSVKTKNQFFQNAAKDILNFAYDLGLETHVKRYIVDNPFAYKIYFNLNTKPFKYPPLQDETRKLLINYYINDITKLEKLINRDLTIWKN